MSLVDMVCSNPVSTSSWEELIGDVELEPDLAMLNPKRGTSSYVEWKAIGSASFCNSWLWVIGFPHWHHQLKEVVKR